MFFPKTQKPIPPPARLSNPDTRLRKLGINFRPVVKAKILQMLSGSLEYLGGRRLVLASGSPRRSEIMKQLQLKVEVIPSTFEEDLDKKLFASVAAYVEENAKQKALEVFARLTKKRQREGGASSSDMPVVIGSDTVVALDGNDSATILEKPKDEADAKRMLASLSGRSHKVYSGVAIVLENKADSEVNVVFSEETNVTFTNKTFYDIGI